ncbi:hypothetical protein HHK36_020017 [Tetracentron sinense]|uniref:Uncharacterized protein n=1 Tax=Tetracentron sinense TaxID=13715 RepID=A0A834YQW1_TETSI|nr:hypothetical protein HHK36_020017 [Tetracentron sinense]
MVSRTGNQKGGDWRKLRRENRLCREMVAKMLISTGKDFTHKDDTFCSGEQYGVQEMTFLEEEEVFQTVKVADTSIKEEANGASEGVEAKPDLKSKFPDKQAEKKEDNNWFDLKVNTHVYVTELPDDVTAEGVRDSSKFMMLGLVIVCGWGLEGETIFDFFLCSGLK